MASEPWQETVYWLDHYVLPTNDLLKWLDFSVNVLGAKPGRFGGMRTSERLGRRPMRWAIRCFAQGGRYHSNGAFLQDEMLPPSAGPGAGMPRYGYYVRAEDVDDHLRRLDAFAVSHTTAARTSEDGEAGTAVSFEDPDGNQYEFWAPARMPEGAMDSDNPLRVGRISHVVQESRDLARTADFYAGVCSIEPIENADVPEDTLVLGLAGGGRMIFKRVERLGGRSGGRQMWTGVHTALAVPADRYAPMYERLWAALPEIPSGRARLEREVVCALPAHTEQHLHQDTGFGGVVPRGRDFLDDDTNTYHFTGGAPVAGSMVNYALGSDD